MPRNFNTNTDNNDEWLTPPAIIAALGPFDLDPCSPIHRPWDTAKRHFTRLDDGLSMPWSEERERERERERVWLNPPYGRETFLWLERLATHGNGTALIFARTETKGFHEQVWDKATALFFFKGRLCFHRVDGSKGGTANAPSCLIAYGEYNAQRILEASQAGKIQGKFVRLKAVRCSKNS